VRFYTFVPAGVKWPYHFYTFFRQSDIWKGEYEHAICDTGVGLLFDHRNIRDYPDHFYVRYEKFAKWVTKRVGKEKVCFVIPDYPADYHNGQCKSSENNVKRTLQNVENFITIEGVEWLPVIQSPYIDIEGFRESCRLTRKLIGSYPRVAIGTVCKTNKLDFIIKCCKIARQYFPNSQIHAFGLTFTALKHVVGIIDSFDTTAWTKPREKSLPSAKTAAEKIKYFQAYLDNVIGVLSESTKQTKLVIETI